VLNILYVVSFVKDVEDWFDMVVNGGLFCHISGHSLSQTSFFTYFIN